MKKTLFLLLVTFCIFGMASAQKAYTMYETMYITPKDGMTQIFQQNLLDHIKKYHSAAPNEASARLVLFGEHEGQFVWVSGPSTFTGMDNMSRPDSIAHNADWALNVEPFIEKYSDMELWKRKDDLSYIPEGGTSALKMQFIRFWEVKPGKYETFMALLKNVATVCKENKYAESWVIYGSQFASGNGRDIAAVTGFKNWAYFDADDPWVADYEKMFGKDSWKKAMETFNEITAKYQEEIRRVL